MAMDCIACAVMPTAAWLTPVRCKQDHALLRGERRRRLCHSYSRRQLFAKVAIAASRVAYSRASANCANPSSSLHLFFGA